MMTMMQLPHNAEIPCMLMRAGTSRGLFFLHDSLPDNEAERNRVLIAAVGSHSPFQVDGIGGNTAVTSKVAIVSPSDEPGCQLDYLFAQICGSPGCSSVDTRPNCGNMLSGVVPFAIERKLISPSPNGKSTVRVFNVNTRSHIDVTVRTPGGKLTYECDKTRIDGVPGTAAPILLNFLEGWGQITGSVFPTGKRTDMIDGIQVTCIDAAMPLMIVQACDLGLQGGEKPSELDSNREFMDRQESMRRIAGKMMGMGDVSKSVIPKPVVVSPGDCKDSIMSRYFTPHSCHTSHAVTGAIGLAIAFALRGTVVSGINNGDANYGSTVVAAAGSDRKISVLHPAGCMDVQVKVEDKKGDINPRIKRAALVRTARKIFDGVIYIPNYDQLLKFSSGSQSNQISSSIFLTTILLSLWYHHTLIV